MAYATAQDAIDLYGEEYILTSVDRDDAGDYDTTALTNALDQATSELDSYIGVKYDLPLSVVPDVLVRFCVDVAVYVSCPNPVELTEEKIERYDKAIKWAQRVADGKATLGTVEPPATAESQGGVVLTEPSDSDRLFTRSKMGGLF